MKIVVASENPVKLAAAKGAFEKMFPSEEIEIVGVTVNSGVADQPMSTEETRRGAENRAQAAREAQPEADFFVGMEGGLIDEGDALRNVPWMCVIDREGLMGLEHASSFILPKEIEKLVRNGMELGKAADQYFGESHLGKKNGTISNLTNGAVDRKAHYEQALIMALIPFRNR